MLYSSQTERNAQSLIDVLQFQRLEIEPRTT